MKMLWPGKIDDVLRQSATTRLAKSIFVKIPRLPTILVIGSQDTSTRTGSLVRVGSFSTTVMLQFSSVGGRPVAGGELGPRVPPSGLLVDSGVGDLAQCADRGAVHPDDPGRQMRAGRFIHEGHELVREARHRAADADAADVGAAADAGHPAALGDVAVDHRTPAAELDQ